MKALTETAHELDEQYKNALQDYLTRGDEESLFRAYDLSRIAIASGLGVLDLSGIHQRMLMSLVPVISSSMDIETMFQRSYDFFSEILSPFEMVFRGFRETSAIVHEAQRVTSELEHRVRQRTVQLRDANEELEAFSYSVAHDLRAPLRAIDGFTRVLLEDYATQLNEEGKHLLTLTRVSTKKMGELIEDLLAFSRISRKELEALSAIDINALVREVVDDLLKREPHRSIVVNIENLPSVRGSPAMLRQVFTNVLSNAIKFTRNRPDPNIRIGIEIREDEYVFSIKDNGIGFEMRNAHKLFRVFQRLHSSDSYEGTGVGLAIVQRIIHRHGGRVWADGEVNKGTTLYFTLPRQEALR